MGPDKSQLDPKLLCFCWATEIMIRAAVAALCFGSSSAFVGPQVQRPAATALQAVPRDDAAKPLALVQPAAQLAAALSLATITIGAPEVACAAVSRQFRLEMTVVGVRFREPLDR